MLDKETILQTVIKAELNSFIEKEKRNIYSSQGLLSALDTSDGSYVKELNSSSGAVNTLLDESYLHKFTTVRKASPKVYMDQLGTNILKIEEPMKLSYAVDLVISLHENLGDTLAGVIAITSSGALINLLHHIVALELTPYLLNNDLGALQTVEKLVVYTYKDLDEIKAVYDTTTSTTIEETIDDVIKQHLLAASTVLETRYVKFIKVETSTAQRSITQHYKVSKSINEVKDTEYYIAAHQLLTKGTFVPYYGVTIVAITVNKVTGHNVSFTKGANISNHEGTSGNVCCGAKSNRTLEGLRTQHHSNLSSPYQSQCMTTSSFTYIKKCIEKSIAIHKANRKHNEQQTTSGTEDI